MTLNIIFVKFGWVGIPPKPSQLRLTFRWNLDPPLPNCSSIIPINSVEGVTHHYDMKKNIQVNGNVLITKFWKPILSIIGE